MALCSARLWGGHMNELKRIKIRRPRLMAEVRAYMHGRHDQETRHDALELERSHLSRDLPWRLVGQGEQRGITVTL